MKTLNDLKKEEEDGGEQGQSFFTGGERSGMLVQGPPAVRDLFSQAQPAEASPAGPVMVFWRNGFSVSNQFYPYGEEETVRLMEQMKAGVAPSALFGGDVNVRVEHRLQEDYLVAPRETRFAGVGHKLSDTAEQVTEKSAQSGEISLKGLSDDERKAVMTVRLKSGARLKINCNPQTHRVADLYNAVRDALSAERGINLLTGRPATLLADPQQTLEHYANSLIQQEWQQ